MKRVVLVISLVCFCCFFSMQGVAAYLTCENCGGEITSRYWKTDDGRTLCDSCYQTTAPRCSSCGVIISGRYRVVDGKNLCENCYQATASRCQICGRIIQGQYYIIGGKYFCLPCYRVNARCYNCGEPISSDKHDLGDGRVLCRLCFEKGVFTQEQLNSIFQQTKKLVKDNLDLEVKNTKIELILSDKTTIEGIARENHRYIPPNGLAGMYSVKIDKGRIYQKIYVIKGLLPEKTIAVLCHEYTHAWQTENCPPKQKLEISEGFAQWVAYRIMLVLGHQQEAENLLRHTDAAYGGGLKLMLAKESDLGVKGLVKYVTEIKGVSSDGKEEVSTILPLAEQVRQQNEKARTFTSLMVLVAVTTVIGAFLIFLATKSSKKGRLEKEFS